MTAAVHILPDNGFALARSTLRSGTATPDQIRAACDVLAASHSWPDIELVRQMRNMLWTGPAGARPLTHAECHAIGSAVAARLAESTFDKPERKPIPRPTATPRRHPDLTSFLFGFLVVLAMLLLVTAAGAHVHERTAATIAQGEAWQVAHGVPTTPTR